MLEYVGVITGFICVWLTARQNILNFPIAMVSIVIYSYIFYEAKLYADMILQGYFFLMCIYGWYYWINRKSETEKIKPVRRVRWLEILLSILVAVTFTLAFGTFLAKQTDAHFPYLDSFCTACSLIASYYSAKRILENWWIWIFVDILYVYLYIRKGLYPTTILYGVYVAVAYYGYLEWKKNWKEHRLKLQL